VSKVITPDDALTRFLLSDRDYSVTNGLVKERAFRPRDDDTETSVFRITDKQDRDIWAIGARDVLPERKAKEPNAKIHARADFNASTPRSLGLKLEFAEPPPDHVIICEWPKERHERMQLSQELAARSFLQLPDKPIE
jgi:hypothetical protein